MSAHAHTGGMTRRRLLHAGALAGVAALVAAAARAPPSPRGPGAQWSAIVDKHNHP
ncbi:cellulase, partial [Xanthomonas euvesicatoria]